MDYRRLGRSGLKVSRLALGCMSYGDPAWRPWVLDETAARPFFRRAVEAGINFFDTADMYSLGVSESITGRLLRDLLPRDEAVIATKVHSTMSPRPNMGGLSRKHIMEQCHASLKRLGTDYVDLYQCHRADADTPLEETLRALDDLVTQGKVLYVGVSEWSAQRIEEARRSVSAELAEKVTFAAQAATEVDVPRHSFDLALFSWSL